MISIESTRLDQLADCLGMIIDRAEDILLDSMASRKLRNQQPILVAMIHRGPNAREPTVWIV